MLKPISEAPALIRQAAATEGAKYASSGRYDIVDGIFTSKRPGAQIAHEVFLAGRAHASVSGRIELTTTAGSTATIDERVEATAQDHSHIVAPDGGYVIAQHQSKVTMTDGDIKVDFGATPHIVARGSTHIWVCRGARPTIDAGPDVGVHWETTPTPRALPVADAGAAV